VIQTTSRKQIYYNTKYTVPSSVVYMYHPKHFNRLHISPKTTQVHHDKDIF